MQGVPCWSPPQLKCEPRPRAHPQGGRGDRDGLGLLETSRQCSTPRNPAPTFPKDTTPRACSPLLRPDPHASLSQRGSAPTSPHRLSAPGQPVFKRSFSLYVLLQIKEEVLRFYVNCKPRESEAASPACRTLEGGRAKGQRRAVGASRFAPRCPKGPLCAENFPRETDPGLLAQQGERSDRHRAGWVSVRLEDSEPKRVGPISARTGAGVP